MVVSRDAKTNYVVYCPFDLTYSKKQLTNVYGPIVGGKAVYLYQWLIDEAEIQSQLKGISSPVDRIYRHFGITGEQFATIRERLEAIGLLATYLQEDLGARVFHLRLKEPLNWTQFTANEQFRRLLISKIGVPEYERISLVFAGKRVPENVLNVSATFNAVFNGAELKKIASFDFERLHAALGFDLQEPVVFGPKARAIVETYFRAHGLTFNEIKRCACAAIARNDANKCFEIDPIRLSEQLKRLLSSAPNLPTFEFVKIHRNLDLFRSSVPEAEKQLIFADYQNINCEQYLSSVQKSVLTSAQKEFIARLKTVSRLGDEIINILTDYMFFKTNGKYNTTYLQKLADTVNCLGLDKVETVHIHLYNAYNRTYAKGKLSTEDLSGLLGGEQRQGCESEDGDCTTLNLDQAFSLEIPYGKDRQ